MEATVEIKIAFLYLFFKIFFFTWAIFKVFIDFVTTLLLFYVLVFFFGPEACGILASQPGIEHTHPYTGK